MTFADPATPSGIDYAELKGALLLFDVTGVEEHIPTSVSKPGEKSPAVRANLTVLDGSQGGTVLQDTLVFPKVLQGQLRPRVGQLVLGRLGQGNAKPGQSAPWKLDAATAEDKTKAEAYLAKQAAPSTASAGNAEPPF